MDRQNGFVIFAMFLILVGVLMVTGGCASAERDPLATFEQVIPCALLPAPVVGEASPEWIYQYAFVYDTGCGPGAGP